MYYKEINFSLPDNDILNIKFLKREEFRPLMFNGKEYTVVGGDDVDNISVLTLTERYGSWIR